VGYVKEILYHGDGDENVDKNSGDGVRMGTQPAWTGRGCGQLCGDEDSRGWEQVLVHMQLSNTCIHETQASMDMDVSMDIHIKSVDMDLDEKFHIHGKSGYRERKNAKNYNE